MVGAARVSGAREVILGRIRAALRDVPDAELTAAPPLPRAYERRGSLTPAGVLDLFARRARGYRATLELASESSVGVAVAKVCDQLGVGGLVVPPALPAHWRPGGIDVIEDHGLAGRELDHIDAALTGCAAAIAHTGTVLLDGDGSSGRRLLSLIPDTHICVIRAEQVVETVPEGLARVAAAVRSSGAPITLVSGPSASSDIELTRVEGVHGPRKLVLLLVS